MLLKVKNVEAENQKLKNKMSKYNLSDLLNEISGTSRVGTLNISAKELVDKMDDLEARGIEVDRLDNLSADGKTNIEFHVFPEGRDELDAAFTVYDFKFGFNPMDEEHFMDEHPFSVGGKSQVALKYAQELAGAEGGMMEEEKKELPDAIKKAEQAQIEKDAKKAKGMMKEDDIDPYYDLRRIKQEVRNQIDSFEKGIIDGDDLVNALEEIIFGRTAPGMMNESVPAVEKMETMKREIRLQLDSFDKGIIDGDDLANAMEEIVFGMRAPGMMEEEDAIEDEPVTEAPGSTVTLSQDDMDKLHKDGEVKVGDHTLSYKMEESVDEAMSGPVKFLKSKGIDDDVISDFMKMHSKDIVGASEDEIMDEFENFRSVNYDYIDENLQNYFARFLKDYQ